MTLKNFLKKTAIFITCCVIAVLSTSVFAASADSTVYTMRKGANAFKYGSVWSDVAYDATGKWESVMYSIGSVSLDKNNGYIAMQMNSEISAFGLTFFIDSELTTEGTGRYMNGATGTPENPGDTVYFVEENGAVTTANEIYGSFNIPSSLVGKNCMLIIPVSAFTRCNAGVESVFDWNACYAFGMITNSAYNYGFSLKLGEVGYFAGDFRTSTMTKIVQLDAASDNAKIYNSSTGTLTMINPTYASDLKNGDVIEYPMKKGEDAFAYGGLLDNVSAYTGADMNGWEAVYYNFSSPKAMTEGGYLVYQIEQIGNGKANFAPILEGKNANGASVRVQTIGGTSDNPVGNCYFVAENGMVTVLDICYDSIVFSDAMNDTAGILIVPLYNLTNPSWSAEPDSTFWSSVTAVGLTTNTYFNSGFSYKFGEIGYYADDPASGVFTGKIFTLENPVDNLALYYTAINSGDMSFISPVHNDYVVTVDGAAIRYGTENSGLRFMTNVDGEYADFLKGYGYQLSFGTIILPADYLENADVKEGVTFEYLNANSLKYLDVSQTAWYGENAFVGAITNLFPQNYDRAFLGRGYMRVSGNGQDFYYYSDVICERTPYDIAVYFYKNEVSATKKAILKGFIDHSVRLSLNEGTLSYDDTDGLSEYGYNSDYDYELSGSQIKLTCTVKFGSFYLRSSDGVTRYKVNKDGFTFNSATGRYEYLLSI